MSEAPEDMTALEDEQLKIKYGIIIAKLRAAVAKNKARFPQLNLISVYLDRTGAEADAAGGHLQRLEDLCAYLARLGSSCYVTRHLHHNLCADVEAARSNSVFFNTRKNYISLPK
ncbi:hypothetical protein [Pontibacter akesuensis]|uniref:Uncharacterized protein n=1 Tax=Pontibacter akesuensis TaxID=388950 RepID=A0A1I7KQV0_9BACT|nr:hypothetical protein [Pontibacter akesuensis]GHA81327.1 hypothetical protein GCM10007389_39820 [Pontibacter akesuensis]SFU99744.1 hypothetical protein SAMN04487941_3997 [Pontibacter akesuensis]